MNSLTVLKNHHSQPAPFAFGDACPSADSAVGLGPFYLRVAHNELYPAQLDH